VSSPLPCLLSANLAGNIYFSKYYISFIFNELFFGSELLIFKKDGFWFNPPITSGTDQKVLFGRHCERSEAIQYAHKADKNLWIAS
jgi:hypothetical protein